MKSRGRLHANEVGEIRRLLGEKCRAPTEDQKRIRHEIRAFGFYISDFRRGRKPFGPRDFDALIDTGAIAVTPAKAP